MSISGERYNISYDPLDQQVNFEGSLRAVNQADLDAIRDYLADLHQRLDGTMRLNFRKLRYLNSAGLRVIIDFLKQASQARKLDIQLIGSKVVAWEEKTLTNLPALGERIGFQVFDRNFYEQPGHHRGRPVHPPAAQPDPPAVAPGEGGAGRSTACARA